MAEGVEEAESNSGGGEAASAMLGAAMPCETSISSPTTIGGLKREFDAYQHHHHQILHQHHQQQQHISISHQSHQRAGSMTPSAGSVSPTPPPPTAQQSSMLHHCGTIRGGSNSPPPNHQQQSSRGDPFHMQSAATGSPNAHQQQQQQQLAEHLHHFQQQHQQQQQQHQPINLKSAEFDKIRDAGSPTPLLADCNSNSSPPPMSQHSSAASCGGGHRHHQLHHHQHLKRPSSAQSQVSTASNNNNTVNKSQMAAEHAAAMCRTSPPMGSSEHHQQQVAAAAAAAHLNGTMQGMLNLQKLQSLSASIQQHSANMPSLASLQGLAGLSAAAAAAAAGLNSPLNLSVGSASTLQAALGGVIGCPSSSGGGGGSGGGASSGAGAVQMPQLILASGQLIQGVQGAQLLIPTAQGITTQTILTIPVSQQLSTNEQLVQTLAALNNGAVSLSNLQHLQSQHHHMHHQQQQQQQQHSPVGLGGSIVNSNFASNSIQQLLAAIQSPQGQQHQHQQQQMQSHHHHHPAAQSYQMDQHASQSQHRRTTQHHLHNHHHSHLGHLHRRNNSMSPQPPAPTKDTLNPSTSSSTSAAAISRTHTPKTSTSPVQSAIGGCSSAPSSSSTRGLTISAHLANQYHHDKPSTTSSTPAADVSASSASPRCHEPTTSHHHHQKPSTSGTSSCGAAAAAGAASSSSSSSALGAISDQSRAFGLGNNNGHLAAAHHMAGGRMHSPSGTSAASNVANATINCINRLTNGELTITKSTGPSPHHSHHSSSSTSSSQPPSSTAVAAAASAHGSLKLSPSSMHMSPTGTDNSNADLLSDHPDEPTINQINQTNVVDGIDLDEIKEFAKAFKLRRLSLGLTQTQVGQALSVTEGPAYSQSAICSALAAQMYAAQLSSQQQQNMFEKLDITPKSAQKIKPVLERWMKEAEESHWNRYKTGQNHLTDFIGVEPSKKRKRRTSFTPQALELLNAHFERNTHPSGTEITGLAHQLGYEREVIRIWFCNKRQALKNTVRMMSKSIV